jgi:hypothetical protein
VLNPHLPGVLGNVLIDALAERVTFEGELIESGELFFQLDTEYGTPGGIRGRRHETSQRWNLYDSLARD